MFKDFLRPEVIRAGAGAVGPTEWHSGSTVSLVSICRHCGVDKKVAQCQHSVICEHLQTLRWGLGKDSGCIVWLESWQD